MRNRENMNALERLKRLEPRLREAPGRPQEHARGLLFVIDGVGIAGVMFADTVRSIQRGEDIALMLFPFELAEKAFPAELGATLNAGRLEDRIIEWPLNPDFSVVRKRGALTASVLRDLERQARMAQAIGGKMACRTEA